MPNYLVSVIIENKPSISDPEGTTILNDLVLKDKHSPISQIRAGKILKFTIKEKDKEKAKTVVQKVCDDLRIYNPLVSKVSFEVTEV